MKINTPAKKSRKKLIIPLVVVLLLAVGGYAAAASMNNLWPFAGSEESQDNSQQETDSESGNTDDSNTPDQNTSDDAESEPANHVPPKYDTPDDTAEPAGLTGVISHASVRNNNLIVRTTINQFLSSGDCTLTLTRGSDGKTVTKKTAIVAGPSTSSCDGFDVPTEELGSGNWNIVINLKSDDKQGRLTETVSI